MSVLPADLDKLSKDEQIAKLKEIVTNLAKENEKMTEELGEFKDVVKRVRLIIKEAQNAFTDHTPMNELKEALIAQAISAGK